MILAISSIVILLLVIKNTLLKKVSEQEILEERERFKRLYEKHYNVVFKYEDED